ncbi:STAS domain-containing protein [Mycobacterium sp. SMC-4]|uniref:STAS domain-containing protein n=1 Tax=Mycobacterium sp. SMC-4 TaxID=2857059 RepID=UPI0021B1AD31|nr:STAS domain-containing protein [Mycobacterium sp. SMC-4]
MGLLDVRCEVAGSAIVVSVKGEVDSGTVEVLHPVLDEGLGRALVAPARLLVLDLDDVTYFGSAGLNAVLGCFERGTDAGIAVRVVATNAEVTRPLEITKLDQVLRPYPSVSAALSDDGDPA